MASAVEKKATVAPKQPDRDALNKTVSASQKEAESITKQLDDIIANIDKLKQTDIQKRDEEMAQAALKKIQAQLADLVGDHKLVREKIKKTEDKIKAEREALNPAGAQTRFGSLKELEDEIGSLRQSIDSGKLRLVEEVQRKDRVALLERRRPAFGKLDGLVNEVAALKESLHKGKDNPEVKELRAQEKVAAKRVDKLAEDDKKRKEALDGLMKEKRALMDKRSKVRAQIKKTQDEFYGALRKYQDYQAVASKSRKEKAQATKAVADLEERLADAELRLSDAKLPAFQDKINSTQSLIRALDPSALPEAGVRPLLVPKSELPVAQVRAVTNVVPGRKLEKKAGGEDEWFFGGNAGKGKNKGAKKGGVSPVPSTPTAAADGGNESGAAAAAAPASPFVLDFGVIQQFSKLDLSPPTSQAEVPGSVATLLAKIEEWKMTQKDQTSKAVEECTVEIGSLKKQLEEAREKLTNLLRPKKEKEAEKGEKPEEAEKTEDTEKSDS